MKLKKAMREYARAVDEVALVTARDAYSPTLRELEELAVMVTRLGYTPDEQDDISDTYYNAYRKERALYSGE